MARSFISEFVAEENDPGAVMRIATAKERLAKLKEIENLDIGEIKLELEILSEVKIARLAIDGKEFLIGNKILGEIIETIYRIKVNYNNYRDMDVARFAVDQLIRRITTEA